jgi:glucan phosphoethanolaminetransferase (alkaline phosphatase superfamily)
MIVGLLLLEVVIFKKPINFKRIILLIIPILIIPGTWSVFIGSRSMYSDEIGISLNQFKTNILNGKLNIESLFQIYRYGVEYFTGNWRAGYVFGVSILLLLISLPIRKWNKDRLSVTLLIFAIAAWLVPVGMFYIASYQWENFTSFLDQSFDRGILPALTLLVVAVIVSVSEDFKKEMRKQ